MDSYVKQAKMNDVIGCAARLRIADNLMKKAWQELNLTAKLDSGAIVDEAMKALVEHRMALMRLAQEAEAEPLSFYREDTMKSEVRLSPAI